MEGTQVSKNFTAPGKVASTPGDGRTVSPRELKKLSPFCDNCRPVLSSETECSLKIFEDSMGERWKCYKHMTCEHAVVLHGAMHSCRVRTSQVREIKTMLGWE